MNWRIDFPVLAELDGLSYRYPDFPQLIQHVTPLIQRWLPLRSNSSSTSGSLDESLQNERLKDHYSHFILRLAFAGTEDLRRRFIRLESLLFRIRYLGDDVQDRQAFIDSLELGWEACSNDEIDTLKLRQSSGDVKVRSDDKRIGEWFKLEFEDVPELVESRRVQIQGGLAYVHVREQISLVLSTFSQSLESGLSVGSRFIFPKGNSTRLMSDS